MCIIVKFIGYYRIIFYEEVMLLLNLKTYTEATGLNAEKLLDIVNQFVNENPNVKDRIIVIPALTDLFWAKQNYPNIIIAAQHVDNVNAGSTTGWIPADTLISYGIEYSLYNHSEHRMYSNSIVDDIKSIQAKGLKLVVCCENVDEAKNLLQADPFSIAYEPKDLIGSGVSVTTRPEAVKEFMDAMAERKNTLIGAGVTTGEDVKKSLELGAEGVLLASAFVKASDPYQKLKELVQPFF